MRIPPIAMLAAVMVLAGGGAKAAIQVATYTGLVQSSTFGVQSFDTTGVFGAANRVLDGLAYTATYTFDTAIAPMRSESSVFDPLTGSGDHQRLGGSFWGAFQSPILSATIEIDGVARSFDASYSGYQFTRNFFCGVSCPDNYGTREDVAQSNTTTLDSLGFFTTNQSFLVSDLNSLSMPTRLDTPGTFYRSGPYAGGVSTVSAWNTTKFKPGGPTVFETANFYLRADTLTISGGVPEPSTWAMMIIGFGAAGSVIRRRKAVVA